MKEKITRYNNVDAHNAIKQLMLRGERLVVRFFSENTQYLPCALVGTDNVKAFKYVISLVSTKNFLVTSRLKIK